MLSKNENEVKSAEVTYNRTEESKKLLEQFLKNPINIKPQIPEGSHRAIFLGWEAKQFKDYMGFQIKLEIDSVTYEHDLPFSAKDPEAAIKQMQIYQDILRDISRQFGLIGDIYIDDLNEFSGQEFDMFVIIKDGKRYTNFYKARELPTTPEAAPKF
jgi:hypothetical protein